MRSLLSPFLFFSRDILLYSILGSSFGPRSPSHSLYNLLEWVACCSYFCLTPLPRATWNQGVLGRGSSPLSLSLSTVQTSRLTPAFHRLNSTTQPTNQPNSNCAQVEPTVYLRHQPDVVTAQARRGLRLLQGRPAQRPAQRQHQGRQQVLTSTCICHAIGDREV